MRPVSVTVQGKDNADALQLASKKLDTGEDNIHVKPLGNGSFEAVLINCDAEVDILVSSDQMSVTLVEARSHRGTGRKFSQALLNSELEKAGVRLSPDAELVAGVIGSLARGETVKDLVIVKGAPAERSQDSKLEPLGDWKYPVFPGDAVGRIIPASNAKEGKKVTGEKIKPDGPPKGKGLNFLEDPGCYIDKTALMIRSERYGMVRVNKQDVYIHGLMFPAKDEMSVLGTVYAKDFRGKRPTPDRMQAALDALDVVVKVDGKSLAAAVAEAEEHDKSVKEVTICRGIEPIDGQDGWFEMIYKDERPEIGVENEDGSIDYRARGVVRSVKAGELLGRLHPPKDGAPGKDIFGKIIPAREGALFSIVVGENVEESVGGSEFTASDEGMVFFLQNKLEVTDVFQTRSDVNMATGNIVVEKGSVHVRGSILSGFSVNSPKNIVVNDVIESANVVAGGDVEVKGGILMQESGSITAKGGVSALYAKNATIKAQGDVNIAHEMQNCIVFAGRSVVATKGRGKIIGCTIRCGENVEANELGSELGVETTVFLGVEQRSFEVELKQKKEMKAILQKIYSTLGSADPRKILTNTPPEKRPAVASLLKARLKAEQKIKKIEENIAEERAKIRRATLRAKVKVYKTIHPGVIINCFGSVLKITDPTPFSQIYYDPGTERLVVGTL